MIRGKLGCCAFVSRTPNASGADALRNDSKNLSTQYSILFLGHQFTKTAGSFYLVVTVYLPAEKSSLTAVIARHSRF